MANDESISILDPRRFTPTLHANLVAEILNLRRDQDDKMKAIEQLEERLFTSRNEIDQLTGKSAEDAKENRSLKRQLALLEGGTCSALGELTKERDEAVRSAAETRRRLETAQKKARSQEEDSTRVHKLWAEDKENWEEERRMLERRIHVAEGRLKTVLDEVAAFQATHLDVDETPELDHDGNASDTGSLHSRRDSNTTSLRFSMFPQDGKPNGMSLADEINFSEEDDDLASLHDGRDSVISTHRRQTSKDNILFRAHRHSNSLDSLRRPTSVALGRILANQSVLDKLEGRNTETIPERKIDKLVYVSSGTQYTPPPSPVLQATVVAGPGKQVQVKEVTIATSPISPGGEREANSGRKRVRASTPVALEPINTTCMVAAGCQTMEELPNPPRTPMSPVLAPVVVAQDSISSSTQTEGQWMLVPEVPPAAAQIPSISIHPPTSRPASPQEPLLPQHFKDAGCQVSMQVTATSSCEASVQTEEIRVDKRLKALPLHLQPSSINSNPPSPEPGQETLPYSPPAVVPPPRNPRRMKSNASFNEIPSSPPVPHLRNAFTSTTADRGTRDSYPGNNDDGPLSHDKGFISRPPRTSSLFAGFDDAVSSDEAEGYGDGDMFESDSDYTTALSAPRPRRSIGRMGRRSATTPVPEEVEPTDETTPTKTKKHLANVDVPGDITLRGSPYISDPKTGVKAPARHFDSPLSLVMPSPRAGAMRRTALVSSGIAAHSGRPRSPSLPPSEKEPPFPIPTRASSRKPGGIASAPSDGNRSPTRDSWNRRGSNRHGRANSIRKIRSVAALPQARARRRRGSRSPPPFSPSAAAPDSPQLPPMPTDSITSPHMSHREMHSSHRYGGHRKQPSMRTGISANTDQSAGSSVQSTSVVDAIAQTMVGEWMFKYVRRRKSFGVADSNTHDVDTNGARHRRWVWLAPYERAVMWSSKQPTSGSALMGKSGRKREFHRPLSAFDLIPNQLRTVTIQSVLDVKDENPPPKGAGNIFNRSILILTPARALKFTATSKERHFIWLTALSFLAHSSQAVPEVMRPHSLPEDPPLGLIKPAQPARLQKSRIGDSIRIAKGRPTPASTRSGPTTAPSSVFSKTEPSMKSGQSARSGTLNESNKENGAFHGGMDGSISEAASPPIVPLYGDRGLQAINGHGRKRSNTGSRVPPLVPFRGFSERAVPTLGAFVNNPVAPAPASSTHSNLRHAPQSSTAGMSDRTAASGSDVYNNSYQSGSAFGGNPISLTNPYAASRASVRTSDASSRPSGMVNNFFEAVGTVRMEAFITPIGRGYGGATDSFGFDGGVDFGGGSPSITRGGTNRRRRSRSRTSKRSSRNRDSFYAKHRALNMDCEDWYASGSKTAGEEDYRSKGRREASNRSQASGRLEDPFDGF